MYATEVDQALAKPLEDGLEQLATIHEGQWFERKSGRVRARDLAIPLVALANAEGGCVVVGIHDGRADGVRPGRVNELRQAAHDFTEPAVRVSCRELPLTDGRSLLILRVDPGDRVHQTTGGDCYLRVGDESRKLNFTQRQELEYDRGSAPYDGTRVDASLTDLSSEETDAYRAAIGSSSVPDMLAARGLVDRDGQLTVAACLLFARHPQQFFPNAHLRVLRYTDVERGTGASLSLDAEGDVRCEGSIPAQIAAASEAIERLMPRRRRLGSSGRFEAEPIIPRDAWLEGVVNAALHRSYSAAGDHVRIEIFPDRIEIASPGRFPGLANPAYPLSIRRYARNPRIARVCSDLGIAQELGEGVKRIFSEMRGCGLTDPIYTQSGASVHLILSSADALPVEVRSRLPKGARRILDGMRRVRKPLGTGEITELVGMTRPTVLRHLQLLRDEGLVSWEGQSARDPRASWRLS